MQVKQKEKFSIGDSVYLLHDTKHKKAGEIGKIYQILDDTVIVKFGALGINVLRNDIEICK